MTNHYPDRNRIYPDGPSRYDAQDSDTSILVGGLLVLFLVMGMIFMFSSRTGDHQTASNTELGAPTTMSPSAPRMPAETTGSGAASTTRSGVP
jgi:hypothetical protein